LSNVQTGNEPILLDQDGWVARIQPPKQANENARVLLLIHGLHGDEKVMWIFTRGLPKTYWMVAPRGPVKTSQGYAWVKSSGDFPGLADFAPCASAFFKALSGWLDQLGAPHHPIDVMGFSQGAAMAYALAAFYPQTIRHVIALAGFLPRENDYPGRYNALKGKNIYIAHGSRDEIVPVHMAEDAVQTLQAAGADVTYCPSDTGHKLSTSCLRGLVEFLQ
jgi:phospholipase/carboxylesterase